MKRPIAVVILFTAISGLSVLPIIAKDSAASGKKNSNTPLYKKNTSLFNLSPLEARQELHKLGITYCKAAFFNAIAEDDIVVVKLFLASGMSASAVDKYNGIETSALLLAIGTGKRRIAKCLIENNADINWTNNRNLAPLSAASINNMEEIVKMLEAKGATLPGAKFDGHRYRIFINSVPWKIAKKRCEELKGHLATVSSFEENKFLTKLADDGFLWLGASRANPKHTWKWVDGTPFKYSNWLPNQAEGPQPEADYLVLCPNGGWESYPNNPNMYRLQNLIVSGYICEWDK